MVSNVFIYTTWTFKRKTAGQIKHLVFYAFVALFDLETRGQTNNWTMRPSLGYGPPKDPNSPVKRLVYAQTMPKRTAESTGSQKKKNHPNVFNQMKLNEIDTVFFLINIVCFTNYFFRHQFWGGLWTTKSSPFWWGKPHGGFRCRPDTTQRPPLPLWSAGPRADRHVATAGTSWAVGFQYKIGLYNLYIIVYDYYDLCIDNNFYSCC